MISRRKLTAVCFLAGALVALQGCNGNLKTSKTYGGGGNAAPTAVPSGSGSSSAELPESTLTDPASAQGAESAAVSAASGAESTSSGLEAKEDVVTKETIAFDTSWEYADHSKICTGSATLYHAKPSLSKGKIICINAGHGTKGGTEVKTLCHPDGTPKVTGGTTETGATEAIAVSTGMEFKDGTPEAAANLQLALITKEKLLAAGYDVLMIRETDDVQLDNVARTVMANQNADCHIALHFDTTDFDKGVFFMSVPSDETYRSMEPVASHWQEHNALGTALVKGLEEAGFKSFEGGAMEMDLTQTSYSTIPSVDLEVGDAASDHSDASLEKTADGIVKGIEGYFS